jgi:hypothetical protein
MSGFDLFNCRETLPAPGITKRRMGRKAKLTVEYYPHYIGDGKKMFIIQKKYKNDGYATWHKLIELLCKTENHYLDFGNKAELMFIASYCDVTEDVLLAILNDLVDLEEIDKDFYENKILWNPKFIESIQDAYAKRSNPCVDKSTLVRMLIEKGRIAESKPKTEKSKSSGSENTTQIQKASKFDFTKALLNDGADRDSVHAWIAVRAKKRAANTEIAYRGFIREVERSGKTIAEIVTLCAEKSWMGFEAKWLENVQSTNTGNDIKKSNFEKPNFDQKLADQRDRIMHSVPRQDQSDDPTNGKVGFEDVEFKNAD